MKETFTKLMKSNPIIAAVKDIDNLDHAVRSDCRIIFLLCGNIFNLKEIVEKVHEKKKIIGNAETQYCSNYREGVMINKEVNILGQHQERQASRQTTSGVSSWISKGSWSIGTEQLLIKANTTNMQSNYATFIFTELFCSAKNAMHTFRTHALHIASSMTWYIPMNMILPMIPAITHTAIF